MPSFKPLLKSIIYTICLDWVSFLTGTKVLLVGPLVTLGVGRKILKSIKEKSLLNFLCKSVKQAFVSEQGLVIVVMYSRPIFYCYFLTCHTGLFIFIVTSVLFLLL